MNPHALVTLMSKVVPTAETTTEELRRLFEQREKGPPPDTLSVVIFVVIAFVLFVGLSTIGTWIWQGGAYVVRRGYAFVEHRALRRRVEEVSRQARINNASRRDEDTEE